jgi:hypothetical protein
VFSKYSMRIATFSPAVSCTGVETCLLDRAGVGKLVDHEHAVHPTSARRRRPGA